MQAFCETSFWRDARVLSRWLRLKLTLGLCFALAACAAPQLPAPQSAAPAPAAAQTPAASAQASADKARLARVFGGEFSAPTAERFLNDILVRLAPASEEPSLTYRVTLLNSPVVNAFALPSGDIFLTRGLLALANDASEVAAVMAHEIAHVSARHAAQRAELERTALLFSRVSHEVLDQPAAEQGPDAQAKLTIAHFSRQQEFEADKIGIKNIAKAGYDPFAAARFLTSLGRWSAARAATPGQNGNGAKPDMMATHPSTPERIAQAILEARQFGAPGVGDNGRDAYLTAIDDLAFGDDPAQGVVRGVNFIHARLGFVFAAPPGFTLENQSAALVCVGEGGGEAIRLDNVLDKDGRTLESAIASDWIDGVKTDSIQSLKLNDLPAATASAQGAQWSFRLAAIRLNGRVIRLIYAARNFSPDAEARFQRALNSFRRASPEDIAAAQFAHIRIIEAQAGDSAEILAQRMGDGGSALEHFLLLNGLDRGARIATGQRYKIAAL